jgi:hypothetical protein
MSTQDAPVHISSPQSRRKSPESVQFSVRKVEEKAQKVSNSSPQNRRKGPESVHYQTHKTQENILQKEIPTNMQEPEDTHPGTRHRT